MATNLELVQQQADIVADLFKKWQDAKQLVSDIEKGAFLFSVWNGVQLSLPELQRQYDYHLERAKKGTPGAGSNAAGVKPYLDAAINTLASKKIEADAAKATYDQAMKDYKDLSATVLTPTEQAQVQSGLDAQIKPNYATGTTKYWIIGGIILVIVIIAGVVIYFKTKKGA